MTNSIYEIKTIKCPRLNGIVNNSTNSSATESEVFVNFMKNEPSQIMCEEYTQTDEVSYCNLKKNDSQPCIYSEWKFLK